MSSIVCTCLCYGWVEDVGSVPPPIYLCTVASRPLIICVCSSVHQLECTPSLSHRDVSSSLFMHVK